MSDLNHDLRRACREHKRKIPASAIEKLRTLISNRGLKALIAYRLRCYFQTLNKSVIWLPVRWLSLIITCALCFIVRVSYGIYLSPQARIDGGLYIGHFGGIAIGRCQIGENCSIGHQVRIGSLNPKSTEAGPVIGDNVWIGPHVTILGDVVIESNATIASGSVVTTDVQHNTLVMGHPARTVRRNYDNAYLL